MDDSVQFDGKDGGRQRRHTLIACATSDGCVHLLRGSDGGILVAGHWVLSPLPSPLSRGLGGHQWAMIMARVAVAALREEGDCRVMARAGWGMGPPPPPPLLPL